MMQVIVNDFVKTTEDTAVVFGNVEIRGENEGKGPKSVLFTEITSFPVYVVEMYPQGSEHVGAITTVYAKHGYDFVVPEDWYWVTNLWLRVGHLRAPICAPAAASGDTIHFVRAANDKLFDIAFGIAK